jgi:hypothetical protein
LGRGFSTGSKRGSSSIFPKIKKTMARGGKRAGAGRKPASVKKRRITLSVPEEFEQEIREKANKISKAYEERCKKEI